MKPWLYSLSLSLITCLAGLGYFVMMIAPDHCRNAGGEWLGVTGGCEGALGYELGNLVSPLGVILFLGILLAIGSLIFQTGNMLLGQRK